MEGSIKLDIKQIPQAKLEATNPVSTIGMQSRFDSFSFEFEGIDNAEYAFGMNLGGSCVGNDRIVGWFMGNTSEANIGGNHNQVVTRIIDSGETYETRTIDCFNNEEFKFNDHARWDANGGIGGFEQNSKYSPLPSFETGGEFILKNGLTVELNGAVNCSINDQFPYCDLSDSSKGLVNGTGAKMHVVEYGTCQIGGEYSGLHLKSGLISGSDIVFLYIPQRHYNATEGELDSINKIEDNAFANNTKLIGIWDNTHAEYEGNPFSGCINVEWVCVCHDSSDDKQQYFVGNVNHGAKTFTPNDRFPNLKYYNGYVRENS